MNSTDEPLFTVREVADKFRVTQYTVRRWLQDDTLEGFKIGTGHRWRIPESSIKKLATERHGNGSSRNGLG